MENHLLLHYIDNKWVDENDLKLSIFDITIMRGFGVFDFLRTYNKKPFGLKEHVERLFYSANEIGINSTKTKKEIYEIIQEGIKKSPYDELYIKLYFTGGVSSDAITPSLF
jgi:branched-chain amino acid aminotransferase